jgi:hypothetical protein
MHTAASAEVYKGYYQFKNSEGYILYQSPLKLTTKEVSKNKFDYVYEELTQKGVVKTTCVVEIKPRSNGGRTISEKCPGTGGYSILSDCDGRLCSGISKWAELSSSDMPASMIDNKAEKTVLINAVNPTVYLGIDGIKTYNHVLILENPKTGK